MTDPCPAWPLFAALLLATGAHADQPAAPTYPDKARLLVYRDPAGTEAEAAFTVHDDFQGRGVGTFLVEALANIAREHGITAFTADVLADNHAMLRVFHETARKIEAKLEAGVYHLRFDLAQQRGENAAEALGAARDEKIFHRRVNRAAAHH